MFTYKIFFACWQQKALLTACKNHENNFLSGIILEVKSKKWILDIHRCPGPKLDCTKIRITVAY